MSNLWLCCLCIENPVGVRLILAGSDLPVRFSRPNRYSRPHPLLSYLPVNFPANCGDQFGVGTIKPIPTVPCLSRNVQIVLAITSELQRVK